jgi:hypothetical protein
MCNNVVDAHYSIKGYEEVDVDQSDRTEDAGIVANFVEHYIIPFFRV